MSGENDRAQPPRWLSRFVAATERLPRGLKLLIGVPLGIAAYVAGLYSLWLALAIVAVCVPALVLLEWARRNPPPTEE